MALSQADDEVWEFAFTFEEGTNLSGINIDMAGSITVSYCPPKIGPEGEKITSEIIEYTNLQEYGQAQAAALQALGERPCNDQATAAAAIPEWWATRPGADVPQLAITLYELGTGNSRWSFTIPHFKGEPDRIDLPDFDKGSYFTTLTLRDNTKLVINANSFAEGERVINACRRYIDPTYLPPGDQLHQGQRRGQSLREVRVRPSRAAYYPTGQQNSIPAWVVSLDQED